MHIVPTVYVCFFFYTTGTTRLEDSLKISNKEVPQVNLVQSSVRKDTVPFNKEWQREYKVPKPVASKAFF